jgi:hypothetical protein
MWTFLIGLAGATAVAMVSAVGFNLLDERTPEAFYTKYTTLGEHETPPEETR